MGCRKKLRPMPFLGSNNLVMTSVCVLFGNWLIRKADDSVILAPKP